MNLTFFKTKVDEKFGSIERFGEELGLTKNAIYKWLKTDRLPDDRVSQIVDLLELDEEELEEFFAIPKVEILMRKAGNTPSDENIKAKFKALANTFFKLDTNNYAVDENILSVVAGQTPVAIANYLRSLLCLDRDEPATLYKTIAELKRHNINLFFFPLERAGYQINANQNREVAFTARKANKIIIFVDTRQTIDQVNFNICHELAHIVCGHQSRTHVIEEEHLCNQVARELIFPRLYIKNNSSLKVFMDARNHSWHETVETFQSLLSDCDWSPKGLALALAEYKYIEKGSHEFLRLMKLSGALKTATKTVDDLYFDKFDPDDIDTFSTFFERDIQKNKEIYKPLIELKKAATFDRLSPKRFAEIFKIDSGDADELVSSWRLREEELEQAQSDDEFE